MSSNCAIAIDVDGTLIPVLVDFDKLRSEVRKVLGIDHPLRPLGESLASLNIDEKLRARAWEVIEKAEFESIESLNPRDVYENVKAVMSLVERGFAVYIVTMRSRRTARGVLEKIGLNVEDQYIVTREDSPKRAEQILRIKEKVLDKKLVFIGDTAYDEQVSRLLGVKFVRVQTYKDLPSAVYRALEMCRDP